MTPHELQIKVSRGEVLPHNGHLPALDAIRGLAILAVMLYRFDLGPQGHGAGQALFGVLKHGNLGVDLFFVLSGFLISGILFDARGTVAYFRNFYVRRALRIFPLYYGVLVLALVLLPLISGNHYLFPEARANQGWLWLYGANFLLVLRGPASLDAFSHFWSLSVEEHFYLLWPVVIFFTSRRQAMAVCLGVFAATVVGRAAWLASGGAAGAPDCFTCFRLDGLALGSFLALAARGTLNRSTLLACGRVAMVVGGAAIIGLAMLSNKRLLGLPHAIHAMFCAGLLVLAVGARPQSWWGRLWRGRTLRFFGKYSYAMYVFQNPLVQVLAPIVTAESLCGLAASVFWGRVAYITLMIGTTTLLAWLSWHCYEKYFLAWKARFATEPTTIEMPVPRPYLSLSAETGLITHKN